MESRIAIEAREAAAGARRQIAIGAPILAELARRLRATPPPLVVTCARGSSDHAATYGKYVIETTVRNLVASVGPSVASMYQRAPVGLRDALFIAVSQSGKSPDVLQLTEAAKRGGALVVGFVNDEASPLAAQCDSILPLCAGEERAVAATKSFLLSGLAFLQLAAAWTGDAALVDAVARTPELLEAACDAPWDLSALAGATSLYVVGRGIGLGAAQELALKLKETCRLHAEAFSTAEVLHGPVALVGAGFPIVAIEQADETAAATGDVLAKLAVLGATLLRAAPLRAAPLRAAPLRAAPLRAAPLRAAPHRCPTLDVPALVAPLCQVQSFYLGVPALAAARGLDADAPLHLNKVTETL